MALNEEKPYFIYMNYLNTSILDVKTGRSKSKGCDLSFREGIRS